jgi:hypothetical protein
VALFEIFVLKNVRRGANQPETDFFLAGFAIRKVIAGDHHHVMSRSMLAIVNHFIDAGLPNGIAGLV